MTLKIKSKSMNLTGPKKPARVHSKVQNTGWGTRPSKLTKGAANDMRPLKVKRSGGRGRKL